MPLDSDKPFPLKNAHMYNKAERFGPSQRSTYSAADYLEYIRYQRVLTEEDIAILMRQFGSVEALRMDAQDFHMTRLCLRGIGIKAYVRLCVLSQECDDSRDDWMKEALGSWA